MFDPRYLISPTGTYFAALSVGLSVSHDGGCSWSLAGAATLNDGGLGPLALMWIDDVAISPNDPRTVYVVTSTNSRSNGLFVSHDDGDNWNAVGTLDDVSYYRRVVAQGGDAFISGYDAVGSGHQHLWKYTGSSNTIAPVTPVGLEMAQPILEYFGASQRTTGLLYLQAKVGGRDAIFKSTDGGVHFGQVFTSLSIHAALLDADDTLWLATDQGLKISRDGGATFRNGFGTTVLNCLARRGGVVYGCASGVVPWNLGQSSDGISFDGDLYFARNVTGTLACPPGTLTHDMCEPMWPTLMQQLGVGLEVDGGTRDGSAAGGSSGGTGANGSGGGGCGCQVGGRAAVGIGLVVALALLGGRRGRRRD
jgi:hypothetical protein